MTEGVPRPRIARSRLPWRLRLLTDPAALRHLLAVLVLAGLLATLVGRAVGAADRAQRRWGATRAVWVVREPVGPGEPLAATTVERRRWPVALVPAGALRARPEATAVAAAQLPAGVPITADALRERPDADRRTVSIAAGPEAPPTAVGAVVDVWAVGDALAPTEEPTAATRIARSAEVVRYDDRSIVVAVDPGEVAAVVAAAAQGRAVVTGST